MRKLFACAVLALVVGAAAAPAMADGPSGSTEDAANEVTCNHVAGPSGSGVNVYAAGNGAYAGSNGVETCSDDETPLDGRIIVTSEQGGYIATDGDDDNGQLDESLTGYLRMNATGDTCSGGTDSTAPESCA